MTISQYLSYARTATDKALLMFQLPALLANGSLRKQKLYQSHFWIPVNHHRTFLGFLHDHATDFSPSWFTEFDFFSLPQGTFLDIGSNLAFFSAFYVNTTHQPAIAFEINPTVADLVETAFSDSPVSDQLLIIKMGLSDKEEKKTIFFEHAFSPLATADPSSKELMEHEKKIQLSQSKEVPVRPLDDILFHLRLSSPISLIKIDVEGMELAVLKGAQKTISQHRPTIFFESNEESHYQSVASFLEKQGYSITPCNSNNYLARPTPL
ncbi:MAG: FkbM family methyltransferase [Candidatus Diapherotrites archaeon]|uniref:FkbM family methyltransferase n=1 Tax=Candidatus Iainarchaeum sp. TaxID=3101447 RepID=A0A8T4L476_9ARCH|nr:FkbM family methyltransferase [Candidatus Diapherotrites archaeon]